MLNLLLVGYGNHAKRRVIPALKSLDREINFSILKRNIEIKSNEEYQFITKKDVLKKNVNFDGLIITSYPSVHLENLIEFNNNSNIFLIEKPITNNLDFILGDEFQSIESTKKVKECLMYFHHPLYFKFKEILKKNKIDKVKIEFTIPNLDKSDYRYSKSLGGSSILDQGIYPISLILENFNIDLNSLNYSIKFDYDFDIDSGGNIFCNTSDGIEIDATWGIGMEYSNLVKIYSNDQVFNFPMFFSKPEKFNSFFQIISKKETEEYNIGVYDQFKFMYIDLLLKQNIIEYNNYENLIKRYRFIKELLND